MSLKHIRSGGVLGVGLITMLLLTPLGAQLPGDQTISYGVPVSSLSPPQLPPSCFAGVSADYGFVGTGTGDLGGVPFEDAPFTMVARGWIDDIVETSPGIFVVDTVTTIEISGFGLATFVTPTFVFSNTNTVAIGLSSTAGDLLDSFDPAFAGYMLDTSIGPIFEDTPIAVGQFNGIETNLGILNFDVIPSFTFQATVMGEVVYDNFPPDLVNAFHSDFDNSDPSDTVQVGDDFVFTQPSAFNHVRWYGCYAFDNIPPANDDFTIRVFELTGGAPTPVPLVQFDVGPVTRVDTGDDIGPFDVYEYETMLPSVALPADGYLLSIVNDTTGTPSDWYWATSAITPLNSWERDSDALPWIQDDNSYAFTLSNVAGELFIRGDANSDLSVNIADAIFLLDFLFGGGSVLDCERSGDANVDCTLDVSDAVYLLTFLFSGGAPPPAPFPVCETSNLCSNLPCDTHLCQQ